MKKSYIKNSLPAIRLTIIQTILFIFLSFLLNGRLIFKLVIFIVFFNFITLAFTIFNEKNRHENIKNAIADFAKDPSNKTLDLLIDLSGDDFKNIFSTIVTEKEARNQEMEVMRRELLDYRDLIELWTHEIKTPISIIDLTLQNHKNQMGPAVYEKFAYANSQIKTYVDNILYFARSTTDKKDYKMQNISVKDAIEESLNSFYPVIAEKEIIVREQIGEVSVYSDFNSLIFILAQILGNAVKYTENLIKIEAYKQPNPTIIIANNGRKIYDKDLPFIYEKGYTGRSNRNTHSTGIGLYLAKSYADDLGIKIEIIKNNDGDFAIGLLFNND